MVYRVEGLGFRVQGTPCTNKPEIRHAMKEKGSSNNRSPHDRNLDFQNGDNASRTLSP